MKFGENLQKLRKEKGISQEQLAEQLGVTRQSVSKWESGNSYPEMDKIVTICNIFHCDMDVLINKDIAEERDRREATSVIKGIFQNTLEYMKKTIYLFEHKGFKDIVKMIAQIMIIVGVILIFSIPFTLLKDIVISVFYSGDNWISLFFTKLWEFIFNVSYVILAVGAFLYIFKIKFLDCEEIIVEEVDSDVMSVDSTLDDTSSQMEKKPTKVVKIKRTGEFSLLDLLSRIITFCIKAILLFCLFPILIWVVMLIIAFVLSVILLFKGVFCIGLLLLILGLSVFSIVIVEVILDFIFNLKFSKRRVIITILSSIIVSSIGLGFSIWYSLNLNVINDVPKSFKSESQEEVYTMSDDFFIHFYDYGNVKYVADNSLTNQVQIKIDYYPDANDVFLEQNENEVYLNFSEVEGMNIKKITDSVIADLKKGRIHTYDQLSRVFMTITTSQKNIDKIQDNYQEALIEEENEYYY